MPGYHEDPKVIQLHRVIGGYIAIFSELISGMRYQMYRFLAESEGNPFSQSPLIEILFANMTARPLTDSFFAMCLEVAPLDEREIAIKRALQSWTQRHISIRNDIAHADWTIGWAVVDTNEPVPPTAAKTRMAGGRLVREQLPLDTSDIIQHINDLEHLKVATAAFGQSCDSMRTGHDNRVSELLETYDVPEISAKRVRRKDSQSG
jgi:hypothetical protein